MAGRETGRIRGSKETGKEKEKGPLALHSQRPLFGFGFIRA